jgi:hypothetical protein
MTDTVEKRFWSFECATLIQNRGRVHNFDSNYLAARIRVLRLGGSLTTFSTVSTQSGHWRPDLPA